MEQGSKTQPGPLPWSKFMRAWIEVEKRVKQSSAVGTITLKMMEKYGLTLRGTCNEGLALLEKAADEGRAEEQIAVAYFLETGLLLKKDEAKAVQCYQAAAHQGNVVGILSVGWYGGKAISRIV
jgi:TPR repeat protein